MSESRGNERHARLMVARLARYGQLADGELAFLKRMGGITRRLRRGDVVLPGADRKGLLYLVEEGWAASAMDLPNGSRELVSLNLAGDLLGLPSMGVSMPLDTIIALSPVSLRAIESSALGEMFLTQPRLAARLFLIAQEERLMGMERAALAGKAQGITRLAALVLRLGERMEIFKSGTALTYEWPLRQKDLADLIGVTDVHVNGLIRSLRETRLAVIEKRGVRILDEDGMWRLAQISPWQFQAPGWLPSA